MAPWIAAGKTVNLILGGVSDFTPYIGPPSYVLNDPNYRSVTCQESVEAVTYPIYYTGAYKSGYKTFIQAVLNRYGSNPNVGYIRFGLGRGGEAYPTCVTQMMQFSNLSTIQQFNDFWENYIVEMTDYEQALQQQLIASNGHAVQLMTSLDQYGSPAQLAVNDWEAQNAKAHNIGFGSQAFSLSDVTANNNKQPCTSDWCNTFQTDSGIAPLELQTLNVSDPNNLPGNIGSLTTLIPFALNFHAQIFEIYLTDFQIAYDPNTFLRIVQPRVPGRILADGCGVGSGGVK